MSLKGNKIGQYINGNEYLKGPGGFAVEETDGVSRNQSTERAQHVSSRLLSQ